MNIKNVLLALEKHVDKIVLGIIALVCLTLLWIYVFSNPYAVEVDGRKLGPSKIDRYVKTKADRLRDELGGIADPILYDKSYGAEYSQRLQDPLSNIDTSVAMCPLPSVGQEQIQEDRLYTLPQVPPLENVMAAHLRGAAQIPTQPVSPDQPYDMVPRELEDLDLVTISSRFDVQVLYNNFQQSFTGPRLKTSWKDQRLAKPIFARLQLERRTQNENGTWGQWETVSRTAIDAYKKLLEELPLTLDQSQYGIEIWSSQYDRPEVQLDILQPQSYTYLVSRTEWMPPEFLDESLEILVKEEDKAKRERLEQLRDRQAQRTTRTGDRRTTERRPTRTRRETADRTRQTGGFDMVDPMMGGMGAVTIRRTAPKERTVADVKKDLDKELLTDKDNLSILRDPLLVWAHDDTVKPGMTYQYRIRLGVFNPIAGKNWFTEKQGDFKNQLVLWSAYSEPTEELYIPQRVYVFPLDVVADKESSNQIEAVQVEVTKYHLGRWHDYEFEVFPGQIIGYEVEDPDEQDNEENMMGMGEFAPLMLEVGQTSQAVDFSTGYTFIDVNKLTVWGSRRRPKTFYQMLYCNDDQNLKQVAVGKTNWDSQTREVYAEIQDAMERSVEQRAGGMSPMMPGMPMDDQMMMDPMMGM